MDSTPAQAVMPTASTLQGVRLQPRRLLALCDLVAAIVTLGIGRELLAWRDVRGWARLVALLALGFTFLLTWAGLAHRGQYSVRRRLSRLSDVMSLGGTMVTAAAVVILFQYATKGFFTHVTDPPRSVVLGGWVLFFVLATLARVFLTSYERHLFAKGLALRRILLVGVGQAAADFIRFLEQRPWLGTLCVGRAMFCPDTAGHRAPSTRQESHNQQSPPDDPVCLTETLEGLENLHRVMGTTGAHEVVVALDEEESHFMPELIRLLTLAHVPFRIVPSLFDATFTAARMAGFLEIPVVDVQVDPLTRFQHIVKRQVDIVAALVALLVGLVPSLFIALAIRLESRGPVFFMQERVGKNGRHFRMYKFRTMVRDAEERLERLREKDETNSDGRLFKIRNDPRTTRVGRFLRKWSLDEFPQFINVLRGEMSVVGPRPPLPAEVANYEPEHFCRLRGTPGITGLWQVSGRSDLSFEEMVRLERYYLENWSLGLDFFIMLKTVYVVLARKGAC